MTYTTEDLKANIRTHIPDFDMATEIMQRLGKLTDIEAELDAPMKPAEAWAKEIFGKDATDEGYVSKIRAIQNNAIASKLPDVDLRGLACETQEKLDYYFEYTTGDDPKKQEDIIHEALLKARGGV